jgi:hypothetical protein
VDPRAVAIREADFCQCMYPHPLSLKAAPGGLGLCYPTRLEMSDDQRMYSFPYEQDLFVTVDELDGAEMGVAGYGDWTATLEWWTGAKMLRAHAGRGLPYVWFECAGGGTAEVRCTADADVWHDAGATIAFELGGRHYALFGPAGSRWRGAGRGR